MSTGASLALIIGSVVAIAAVLILLPQRSAEPAVMWMRPQDHRIAHAFRTAELRADLPDVQALAFCGRWPVAALVPVTELVPDDDAPRCAVCERAVAQIEHRE